MPKLSKFQPSFNAGEVSPLLYGRVDAERYKSGLGTCLNYIPTIQGPLVRRPGTRWVANVKDPAKPPVLVPFQYSATQAYMLEFGDQYVRFYANGGQIVANTSIVKVVGVDAQTNTFAVFGLRANGVPNPQEIINSSSVITASSILELTSPYSYTDVAHLKWAQNENTLYLTHPNYPVYKLQYGSNYHWDMYQVKFQDGPYLPLNSYATYADQTAVQLIPATTSAAIVNTGPVFQISSCVSAGSSGLIQVTTTLNHGYQNGQKVVVLGVVGTTEANNTTVSIPSLYWTILVTSPTTFSLINSNFVNAYVGSGLVYPALFQPNPILGPSGTYCDVGRNIRLYSPTGSSAWGVITNVSDMRQCTVVLHNPPPALGGTSPILFWQLGVWSKTFLPSNNFPSCVSFHQNRLLFAGAPNVPQQIDGSVVGQYESFAPNNIDTLSTAANNAFQFTLNSAESNKIQWLKSTSQGLLAGSYSSEWNIAPSSQQDALSPTNFNAAQTGFFGSIDVDAIQLGNATLHVSRAGKKLREMSYFFQLGTFRSTDLTELSEHLGIAGIVKLAVQKETQPVVWAVNSSGGLLSMSYNRDDLTLRVGWARHQLGGASDSAGSPPIVSSIGVIPAQDQSYDQLWLITKRYINGSSATQLEVMTNVYNDTIAQEDSFQLDCGSTYDSPFNLSNITVASSALATTLTAHGFLNGDTVRINNVTGLNVQLTDINGNTSTTNLVNGKTFLVGSSTTFTFNVLNFDNTPLNTNSSSIFVGGTFINAAQVRKLYQTISGVTQLKNETVGVLADGAIHPDVLVNSSGTVTLQYPASKVQFGYRYNSDGATLTTEGGSAQGSSIGSTRRIARAAVMMHQIGDISIGTFFTRLIPVEFQRSDVQLADTATPLFSGIHRDGVESAWDFADTFCFRQSSPLPGMVQAVTLFMEENDV